MKTAHVEIMGVLQACEFIGTRVIISLSMLKHVCTMHESKRVCEVVVGLYRILTNTEVSSQS